MSDIDLTQMTDEEILNMERAPLVEVPATEKEDDPVTPETTEENSTPENQEEEEEGVVVEEEEDNENDDPNGEEDDPENTEGNDNTDGEPERNPLNEPDGGEGVEPKAETPEKKTDAEEPATDKKEGKDGEEPKEPETPAIDYEAEYKKLMAPFKANGKTVNLQSPDELIKLAQMGANYTKKMQSLQPNLRMVKMLQNNGLTEEADLSYLIDLHKKQPEAIKKLLKDSNIDPMDIDTTTDSEYKPGNYSVSDKEMVWDNIIQDLSATESGGNLLVSISKEWDNASKDEIYKDPQILNVLAAQKENGVYDQIFEEVNRQRVLGQLNGVSQLQAYYNVGTAMQQAGRLVPTNTQPDVTPVTAPVTEKKVLEVKSAAKAKPNSNADKAKAATPVKVSPKSGKTKQETNPLSLSDDEFEKVASMATKI